MIATPASSPQKVFCSRLHIERAQQGFTMCVDCRRRLFPAPKSRCRVHGTYACNECFRFEEIAEFARYREATGRMM